MAETLFGLLQAQGKLDTETETFYEPAHLSMSFISFSLD